MVFTGYLQYGGAEIVNGARVTAYTQMLLPNLDVRGCVDCDDLAEALGHKPYTSPFVDQPEWFDVDNPDTWDFYGLYPLSFEGFEDATTTATITQYSTDGGSVSPPRRGTRSMRVTGLLIGLTPAAVSAGMTWLRQALRPARCRDGLDCNGDHLCYLAACPPLCTHDENGFELPVPGNHQPYRECDTGIVMNPIGQCTFTYERHLYETTIVDGPTIIEELSPSCGAMVRVEFTIVAGVPSPYGTAVHVSTGPDGPLATLPNTTCAVDIYGKRTLRTNQAVNPSGFDPGGWTSPTPAQYTVSRDPELGRRDWIPAVKLTRIAAAPPIVGTTTTNLATNPSFQTVSATRVPVRTNLASDPAGTAQTGPTAGKATWVPRWFGSGGAGTTTLVTAATDGPVPGLGTYLRKTWTTAAANNGDSGYLHSGPGSATGVSTVGLPVTAGVTYAFSSFVRPSSAGKTGAMTVYWRDAAGNYLSAAFPGNAVLPANVWTRFSVVATAPANAAAASIVSDIDGGTLWAVGDTLDGTGLLIEAASTVGSYFDGVIRPPLRVNLSGNPGFETNISVWQPSGSATLTRVTTPVHSGGYAMSVATTGGTNQGTSHQVAGVSRVTSLAPVTVSLWVYAPAGLALRLAADEYTPPSTAVGSTPGPEFFGTGDWQRVSVTRTPAAIGNVIRPIIMTTQAHTAATFYIDDVLVEAAPDATAPFFDGSITQPVGFGAAWYGTANNSASYTYDADLSVAWTGTANNSPSTWAGVNPTGVTTSAASQGAISSTQWAGDRTRSVRIVPTVNATSSDSFAAPAVTGMLPGRTYTAQARIRLAAPQVGTEGARTRRIVAFYRTTSGGATYFSVPSQPAPNVAGETDLSLTFSLPADTTEAFLRLYNGIGPGGTGDVWWDNFMLFEGSSNPAGRYWDGSTTPIGAGTTYAWSGTADASTSVRTTTAQQPLIGQISNIGAYGTTQSTLPLLIAGLTHVVSLYVLSPVATTVQWRNQPADNTGAAVGPVLISNHSVPANEWTRIWTTFDAPATAVRLVSTAGVSTASGLTPAVGSWVAFADMLVETDFGSPLTYFDGDSPIYDPAVTYEWTGDRSRSTSIMILAVAPSGPIIDPDCPPVPAPPRPPVIDSTCVDDPTTYLRYSAQVPADAVPVWSDAVPIIQIFSNIWPVRQLRIRFYANPFEVGLDQLDPCTFCGEFIVSYLPPESVLTLDGIAQTAKISQDGGPARAASHLLYGSGGGPMVWPELTCGIRYDMAVDIAPDNVEDLRIDLCIAGRE